MSKTEQLILDGHKLGWHQERVAAWLRGEKIAPITIDCALTPKCTYRCVYCYGQLQCPDEQPIEREYIMRFLDDAAQIGVKAVSFISDGESTCSPYLYDAILHGCENGLDMSLGTNGYLLQDERLEEIMPALTYLRFNISAATRERYSEIHGCKPECYDKVINTIKEAVAIKRKKQFQTTIGLQMVLLPEFEDQIIPLAELGRDLGVDYLVIKHCSDDEMGSLKVDYSKYEKLTATLEKAEKYSTESYVVKAKWSKILSGGTRKYSKCYGPPFIIQLSGSGLVAPCGMFFNDKYKKFHIGNIKEKSFKEIWESDRYWEVMNNLQSEQFDARTDCGTLCLQHKVNEYLWDIKQGNIELEEKKITVQQPQHINFI